MINIWSAEAVGFYPDHLWAIYWKSFWWKPFQTVFLSYKIDWLEGGFVAVPISLLLREIMLPIKCVFFLFISCFFKYKVKKYRNETDLWVRWNYGCLTRFSSHIFEENYAIKRRNLFLVKKNRLILHLLLFILLMVYLMTANEDADSVFYSFVPWAGCFTNEFCSFYTLQFLPIAPCKWCSQTSWARVPPSGLIGQEGKRNGEWGPERRQLCE